MLEHHPWFEVAWLAASDRFRRIVPTKKPSPLEMKLPLPAAVAEMTVSG